MESDAPRAGLLRQLPALAAVVALGALNSVIGKIRAVKLGVYDGLIAGLINAFVYFLVYVGILCSRLRSVVPLTRMRASSAHATTATSRCSATG